MEYLVAIIVGYLLGCINPAYILGRLKGFDIRTRGTFSAGASNAKVTMGWPYFFICLIYDASKSVIAFLIIRHFFPANYPLAVLAGSSAVIGHIFPFYLNFKGGKGFAAYIGLALIVDWKSTLIIGIIGLILAFLANWIVATTFTITWGVPIYQAIVKNDILVIMFLFIATIIIFLKHLVNLKKVRNGEEIGINGKPVSLFLSKEAKERLANLQAEQPK